MTDASASLTTFSADSILVVGGTGETGKRILQTLRRRYPDLRLHYASRTAAAAGLLPADIPHVPLDLTQAEQVKHVLRGYSLVLDGLEKGINDRVVTLPELGAALVLGQKLPGVLRRLLLLTVG